MSLVRDGGGFIRREVPTVEDTALTDLVIVVSKLAVC